MQTNQLCKGFSTSRFNEQLDCNVETLYAVLADGTVLESDERPYSISFNRPGFAVSSLTADEVKARAEFIGNYDAPKVSK